VKLVSYCVNKVERNNEQYFDPWALRVRISRPVSMKRRAID
jgi:hypothetical protein